MTMKLGEATIAPGTISGDVKDIQRILAGQGYNVGPIDGHFGVQTLTAVKAFQNTKQLLPDGIVGPQTWAALQGKVAEQPSVFVAPVPAPPAQNKSLLLIGLGFTFIGYMAFRK